MSHNTQQPSGTCRKQMRHFDREGDDNDYDDEATDLRDEDGEEERSSSQRTASKATVQQTASKRLMRNKSKSKYSGIRLTSMRKIAKRAAVRMCRKDVHVTIKGIVHNFVAGIMHDACAIEPNKTLSANSIVYALDRRGHPILI